MNITASRATATELNAEPEPTRTVPEPGSKWVSELTGSTYVVQQSDGSQVRFALFHHGVPVGPSERASVGQFRSLFAPSKRCRERERAQALRAPRAGVLQVAPEIQA